MPTEQDIERAQELYKLLKENNLPREDQNELLTLMLAGALLTDIDDQRDDGDEDNVDDTDIRLIR